MKTLTNPSAFLITGLVAIMASQTAIANDRPFGERSIFSDRAVSERIAPVGKVCEEGDTGCGKSAATEMTVAANTEMTPEQIYSTKCQACHASGMMGAPLPGAPVWQTRIEEIGLDQIVAHAINGFNSMPAKGMCMECSDADIRATVEYMISYGQ